MWKNLKRTIWKDKSIQTKIIWTQVLMMVCILLMNLFIYQQINRTVQRIDAVFSSNVTVNELSETLEQIQDNVYEYLNTKSSAALEDYYRYEQEYRTMIERLNSQNMDSEVKMLEKNIRNMSETYLTCTNDTVQAKRGRNVEKYKSLYEEETQLYEYINSYMYKLNNLRFHLNSANYQVLLRVMSVLEIMSILMIGVVGAICMFMAVVLIRSMIEPLTGLSVAANQVAKGNFEVEFPAVVANDEVGIVTNAFHQMVDSIKEYIEKQRVSMENEAMMKERELSMEAHLKDAQLKFLQAQINPHFLFNCLNAGAQLAAMEDAERTAVFVSKMADLFRYNVRKMGEDANLYEEIEAVDNYIYILNVRYAGDLCYKKEIDGDVENIRVPSMLLQPIVENAVQHGVRDRMENAGIWLRVARERGQLRVTVRDNGSGMTEAQIQAVLSGNIRQERREGDSTGIGLDNVMNRLKLYYKRENLFDIYSEGLGKGTEVTILLPLETKAGGTDVSDFNS
ncbi:HAMP domain protein [Marvinbryantia formatexigens DSM 14469]|uniref:histidine kinase n=1 Tax=Marvinbryantia formatexigens DSM 14469 TaxID=478749 RepID=C6LLK4_9FIRM|nr:histidine kinase [Marvinbryantia formatexigens]EET58468.1 HAMP domain protein [Marvinbryantia formatexigens DSM 14469]UWO26808.1 histidine kinase [Marvinbryantia formatexigens DSM 14469]SDH17671.1 Histidine kinase-, DNA gyrase B-, and HSP90-like ATPase [Marvinbryantia formatexigens]